MAPSIWSLMKRQPPTNLPQSKLQKMVPQIVNESTSRSSGSSLEAASQFSCARDDDYSSFMSDVLVVGAGPAGLMLADNLVRYGIKTRIIDDRPDRTLTGRADGIQPKTIETLRQMRIAEPLLRKGVKVYDIAFWKSTAEQPLHRSGREVHYPPLVDLLDPYILLVHQGMVEDIFEDDLRERGNVVSRNTAFVDLEYTPMAIRPLTVHCQQDVSHSKKTHFARYVVGCDGARSKVRKCIPGATLVGASSDAVWGVLDGVLETDFPDIWGKVVIQSETLGSVLMIPRERGLTRLYIELRPDSNEALSAEQNMQEFVQKRAQAIMLPFRLTWKNVEWFGRYKIGQRFAARFMDAEHRVFIAGDASHTHSPKAAQGMNTSMHDSWNLAWKLNFATRGLAKPCLLESYEDERKKIAQDLIDFDYEHANAFADGDPAALADNFAKNVAFISGYGVSYQPNVLNVHSEGYKRGNLRPGFLLPPAKATRYIDANPVDIQLDIPALGQFRIYFFTHNVHTAMPFLEAVCQAHSGSGSYIGRVSAAGNASYTTQPPLAAPHDQFVLPERYTPVSGVFTYALVTDMDRKNIEISDLPSILRESAWTFYLDDIPEKDTRKQKCMDKWLDGLNENEIVILNVRPDGYVGTVRRFANGSRENIQIAIEWMDHYYEQFMRDIAVIYFAFVTLLPANDWHHGEMTKFENPWSHVVPVNPIQQLDYENSACRAHQSTLPIGPDHGRRARLLRAKAHRQVDFTVIINPCSGPCVGSLPDQVYLDEIPKLRAYPNIRTIGYVATHYAGKPIESVLAEIDLYAKWPKMTNDTKMSVDGIFLDETPSTYYAEDYEYLKRASQAVRNQTAFKDRFVAQNPGLLSPSILNSKDVYRESYLNLTDITVVFEETFEKWIDKATLTPLQSHKIRRSKLALLLHSLPNLSRPILDFIIEQVEETADWMFLTDVKEKDEYYHSFSSIFTEMVHSVDGKKKKKKRGRVD
ncbi:FAD binding domain-containing protein [Phaeosphaeriaceae sp. PMI808]|nr:FAD binding domain-containing protein [Phaeosphaeriaceae sp. PMI808]